LKSIPFDENFQKWATDLEQAAQEIENTNDGVRMEDLAGIYYVGYNTITTFIEEYNYRIKKQKQALVEVQNRKTFVLSNSYTAEFTKGSNIVTVGCQKFNIDVIKNFVAAWDQLNS
jgi:uncharacterized protein (DUF1800 family)